MLKIINFSLIFTLISVCWCQKPLIPPPPTSNYPTNLHVGLSEGIGNFSIELLYFTSNLQQNANLIISPITVWTVLAVISEGATENTRNEIKQAIIVGEPAQTRKQFKEISSWLLVKTGTVLLSRVNAIFLDEQLQLEKDFKVAAEQHYQVKVIPLKFSEGAKSANSINRLISNATSGRIPHLVDSSYFDNAKMILTSALYFKGQWTAPFNTSSTEKKPFYDSNGRAMGEVNMMYNRFTYPFANIKELQARILELPYGKENRLSMLIMLPNPHVSLQDMFRYFHNVTFDRVFNELKISQDDYGDDEVDCFIPRFKIESNVELTPVLRHMRILDLFDERRASLENLARVPLYVSRVIHKAEIEVTEEGTVASGVTAAEFANRIGVVRFEANRPFAYMIVEKVTNTIVFGGLYQQPSLY